MFGGLEDFKTYPSSVRYGLFYLVLGWAAHFYTLYQLFGGDLPRRRLYEQAVIAASMLVFVGMAKNWARILCLLANALIMLIHAFIIALCIKSGLHEIALSAFAALVLFAMSTWYLAIGESSEFFKSRVKVPEPPLEEEGEDGSPWKPPPEKRP